MRFVSVFVLFISLQGSAQNSLPALGMWREHLPYQGTIDVTYSDKKIYAATEYSLFSIDRVTKEIERISKIWGLSETGIQTIQFDRSVQKLIIGYKNSNIDIIDENGVHNIPDLKRRTISGDKNIYQVYTGPDKYYLSTGIGIIVIDPVKFEISDSWLIGSNGGYVKTNAFTRSVDFYYAATEEGLKKTPAFTGNPADFTNWQLLSGSNGLSKSASKAVVNVQDKIIVLQNDSLFIEKNGFWELFFTNNQPIHSINTTENKLIVCQGIPGSGRVVVLNPDASVHQTLEQQDVISFPKKGISVNNEIWMADLFGGLSHWQGATHEIYKLNSPDNIALGQLAFFNDQFYAAAGTVNTSWNYQYNPNGIYTLKDDYWKSYNQYHFQQLDSLLDFISVAVDPRDQSIWAGSYGGGLLHIKTGDELKIFKQSSPIGSSIGDPGSYRVSGLAFDRDNNLWISNFGSDRQLHVIKNNGEWTSFTIPFFLNVNAVSHIVIDDANQKWIASPLGNGVIVFNDNHTIDNVTDDQWKLYRSGAGNGNLPSAEVLCLAKDKTGFIWIGTTNGVGVIQCPQQVFQQGCDAILPVIQEGGFANYLFKGEAVKSIAVDGADRKWIATANGAWLISKEGDKVLEHFTEENSSILSNDVRNIAINGKTGEVFFATTNGICSYRGAATEASEDQGYVLVFPNPVSPDYTGNIAIKGLPENSFVKITETNGRLVYQTRSLGGQALWNGKDYRGARVATGIYLVLVADETKQEKAVAKIVFISK